MTHRCAAHRERRARSGARAIPTAAACFQIARVAVCGSASRQMASSTGLLTSHQGANSTSQYTDLRPRRLNRCSLRCSVAPSGYTWRSLSESDTPIAWFFRAEHGAARNPHTGAELSREASAPSAYAFLRRAAYHIVIWSRFFTANLNLRFSSVRMPSSSIWSSVSAYLCRPRRWSPHRDGARASHTHTHGHRTRA